MLVLVLVVLEVEVVDVVVVVGGWVVVVVVVVGDSVVVVVVGAKVVVVANVVLVVVGREVVVLVGRVVVVLVAEVVGEFVEEVVVVVGRVVVVVTCCVPEAVVVGPVVGPASPAVAVAELSASEGDAVDSVDSVASIDSVGGAWVASTEMSEASASNSSESTCTVLADSVRSTGRRAFRSEPDCSASTELPVPVGAATPAKPDTPAHKAITARINTTKTRRATRLIRSGVDLGLSEMFPFQRDSDATDLGFRGGSARASTRNQQRRIGKLGMWSKPVISACVVANHRTP